MLYYITDFSNYEAEFEYTDKVILSAGINDITRRYMTPESICDVIIPQLRRFSARYPDTTFIFNTVLLTSSPQTNDYVHRPNRYVSEAIETLPSAILFNSHNMMRQFTSNIKSSVYVDKNGIHLRRDVIKYLKDNLVAFLNKTRFYLNR